MARNPVSWFEIYVQDSDRAKLFYETVLGIELGNLQPPDSELVMYGFPGGPDNAGATGALVKVDGMPSGGNSTLVYFGCEDCGVEASRVEDAGGRLQRDKMSIGEYGYVALAIDPDGNMFGLHSIK